MARHPAAWRPRDESHHPIIHAVKEHYGYGVAAPYVGLETYEKALEFKRGVHRAGKHLKESVRVDLVDAEDGTITAVITLYDKAVARQYIKDQGRWNGRR